VPARHQAKIGERPTSPPVLGNAERSTCSRQEAKSLSAGLSATGEL
jgi:hypothetical protein